jgi:hypothetical protein
MPEFEAAQEGFAVNPNLWITTNPACSLFGDDFNGRLADIC